MRKIILVIALLTTSYTFAQNRRLERSLDDIVELGNEFGGIEATHMESGEYVKESYEFSHDKKILTIDSIQTLIKADGSVKYKELLIQYKVDFKRIKKINTLYPIDFVSNSGDKFKCTPIFLWGKQGDGIYASTPDSPTLPVHNVSVVICDFKQAQSFQESVNRAIKSYQRFPF